MHKASRQGKRRGHIPSASNRDACTNTDGSKLSFSAFICVAYSEFEAEPDPAMMLIVCGRVCCNWGDHFFSWLSHAAKWRNQRGAALKYRTSTRNSSQCISAFYHHLHIYHTDWTRYVCTNMYFTYIASLKITTLRTNMILCYDFVGGLIQLKKVSRWWHYFRMFHQQMATQNSWPHGTSIGLGHPHREYVYQPWTTTHRAICNL